LFFRRDNDNDVVNDPAVKSLVLEQTNQWSEMVERHRREEWQLLRAHLQAQVPMTPHLQGQVSMTLQLQAQVPMTSHLQAQLPTTSHQQVLEPILRS
jgi:phosphatidylinositol phospholipase C beta